MNMIIIQVDHPDHPHQTDHLTTLITLSSPTIWLLWPFWPPWLQWLLLTGTIIWKFCKTKISRNILQKKIENDNLQKVCPEQQFTNNDLEQQKLITRTGYLQKVLIIIKSKLITYFWLLWLVSLLRTIFILVSSAKTFQRLSSIFPAQVYLLFAGLETHFYRNSL